MKAVSKPAHCNHPTREADGEPAAETTHVKPGVLDGKPVTVLVGTCSCMSVVQADLVDKSKLKEGTAELKCVHGDSISYPTAQITLEIDGWSKEPSVAVVPKLPVDVLISWKDYPSTDGTSGITSLAVLTRSQKKKQIEHTQGCEGGDGRVADRLEGNGPATRVTRGPASQYLPWHPQSSPAQATDEQPDMSTDGKDVKGEDISPATDAYTPIGDVFQASPQQLAEWQQTDPTLSKIRELISGGKQAQGRHQFLYQDGLLYRKWSPDSNSDHVKACEQLVLLKQCSCR